jgi:hypothetical protein
MHNAFCADCGHLLSKRSTHCGFCGWSDRIDDLAYRGFDQAKERDLVYILAGEYYSEPGIRA